MVTLADLITKHSYWFAKPGVSRTNRFRLVGDVDLAGIVTIYIHPEDASGETLDFTVVGNELKPIKNKERGDMTASDILLNGDCSGPREALELYAQSAADASEWWLKKGDSESFDCGELHEVYAEDVKTIKMLLWGMTGDGSKEQFERWATSADLVVAHCGRVLLSGKYQKFSCAF